MTIREESLVNIKEILKFKDSCLKDMDEQRQKDWLNKINSRPRRKGK